MSRSTSLALVALAACTDLGDVDRDRCGNGVVEPARGEDCDRGDADDPDCGAPGSISECRLLCGSTIEGSPTCPAGAACGADAVCHAPAGTFGVSSEMRWTARSLLVGDTTADGYPELVGVSDEEIVALLGAPDGAYAAALSVPNLPVFDEPRMSDLTGDGVQDLAIPVGFGLYSLAGNAFSVLDPLFQNSFAVPSTGRMVTANVDYFFTDPTGQIPGPIPNAETISVIRVPMGANCGQPAGCEVVLVGDTPTALPVGRKLNQLAGDTIPWAWVPGAENQRFVFALAFADDPMTVVDDGGVFLYRANLTVDPPALSALGQSPTSGKVVGRAWLADVDGDSYQDLLATTLAIGNPSVSVSYGRGDGAFETSGILIGGPGPSPPGTDAVEWGDVTGDRKADYVSGSGIQINQCATRSSNCFGTALVSDRDWIDARIVDVDGDGRNDVVAHAQGAIVVDVLRNTGLPAVWNEAPLTVPGAIKALRVGDFDANGSGDAAIVTTVPGLDASDGLYVAYGRSGDGLAPPTYMGYVGTYVSMQPATSLLPGRFDNITDLVVVGERGGTRGAALVLGSTSQRMVGPLIPIGDGDADANIVEGIVTLPLDGDATADVICLISEFHNDGRSESVARVFTSSADGALTERSAATGVTLETSSFLLRGARWVTVPATKAEPAYVIGVDSVGRVAAIPIVCTGAMCGAGALQDLTGAVRGGESTDLDAVDLEGDGDLDLVAAFKPLDGPTPPSHVRVWMNDGGFSASTQIAAPADAAVASIAAVDLDLDGRRELYALVRGPAPGLYAASPSDAGYGPLTAMAMTDDGVELGGGLTLVGDDLTGDGLADLVGVFGPEGTPQTLKVLVQRERLGALSSTEAP